MSAASCVSSPGRTKVVFGTGVRRWSPPPARWSWPRPRPRGAPMTAVAGATHGGTGGRPTARPPGAPGHRRSGVATARVGARGPVVDDGRSRAGRRARAATPGRAGGAVWSTTRPSRRNTTRSAHDASWASWVTTMPATAPRHAAADQAHHRLGVDRVERRRMARRPAAAGARRRRRGRSPPAGARRRTARRGSGRPGRPDRARRAPPIAAARRRLGGDTPSSSSGRLTFSAAVSPASRLKSWNTKPMARRRSRARSLRDMLRQRRPVDEDLAAWSVPPASRRSSAACSCPTRSGP